MRDGLLLFFLLIFLLMGSSNCEAQLYQWADDKGTLHFSESPPENLKSPDNKPDKDRDKGQVRNRVNDEVKKNTVINPARNQGQAGDKTSKEEDTQAILNRLEVGNRTIPEDMKKYGPASPEGPSRRDQGGDSQPVRRSSS